MNRNSRGIELYKKNSQTPKIEKPVKEEGLLKIEEEDKYTRVAKLLIILGKEEASSVIKTLPESDIDIIAQRISSIERIGKIESYKILKEFGKEVESLKGVNGGVETARSFLYTAFGKDKGSKILYKVLPEQRDVPFSFLHDLDFKQIMLVLKDETVSVLTIILNYLPAKKSSPIIEALEDSKRKEIILRLAKIKDVSPSVISIITERLQDKVKNLSNTGENEINGEEALLNIIKNMDMSKTDEFLSTLDRDLAENLKNRLYTIDIIYDLKDTDLQKILQGLDDKEIVYLLRGESESIQEKILSSVSQGRRVLIEDEYAAIGPVKRSEAATMTRHFIEIVKSKRDSGEISLLDDDLIY